MRLARPHPGGPALLWFGVLGAPLAWALQLAAGFGLTQATCGAAAAGGGWDLHLDAWTIAVAAVAVTTSLAALAAAIATFRAVRGAGSDPPAGRILFLAVIGIAIAPLFAAMILMSGLGAVLLTPCVQG